MGTWDILLKVILHQPTVETYKVYVSLKSGLRGQHRSAKAVTNLIGNSYVAFIVRRRGGDSQSYKMIDILPVHQLTHQEVVCPSTISS